MDESTAATTAAAAETPLRRPTSTAEIRERGQRFSNEESRRRGMAFQPRPTDVFISPNGKSGTTWLQQIVHGLRTRGDMSFGEITEVVPWIEMAYSLELDPEMAQPFPRAFKSHMRWDDIPKGARYIVSIRNPRDVLVSSYHFFENWWFEPGTITLEQMAHDMFMAERNYWKHLISWWPQRDNPDVLLLSYEEMRADLPATIRTVAKFIGIDLDDELMEIVLRQSSQEFMSAHAHQFDDNYLRRKRDHLMGLPPGGDSTKVRSEAARRVRVSPELQAELDAIWCEEIEPRFGLATYDNLRRELVKLRAKEE